MRDKFRSNLIYFVNRSMLFFSKREGQYTERESERERKKRRDNISCLRDIHVNLVQK